MKRTKKLTVSLKTGKGRDPSTSNPIIIPIRKSKNKIVKKKITKATNIILNTNRKADERG